MRTVRDPVRDLRVGRPRGGWNPLDGKGSRRCRLHHRQRRRAQLQVSSPDFENPTDRARVAVDLNGDGDEDDPGEAAVGRTDDNDYQITVSATEVWNGSDEALPAKRTDLDRHGDRGQTWMIPAS